MVYIGRIEGKMRNRCSRTLAFLLICTSLFSMPGGVGQEKTADAKAVRTLNYTMEKGSTINISKILNGSKLSKKKKKKAKKCNWKSKKKKLVKVYKAKKKIKALKTGTTYIKGYYKKKLFIRIKIKVIPKKKTPALIRTTSKGQVKGKKNSAKTALMWYGIPYAASTAGANRFRAPQEIQPWTGVRSATKVRARAAQYSSSEEEGYVGTENCLYVNVYRPYTVTGNLPVLVYLHGGGNCKGTANVDFAAMAQATNSVIVSVSYRVGAFGFLSHPALQDGTREENSGNFALLDVKKALQWVKSEIASFGGDADNVTLSGFSGGARMVLMSMISPAMKGLFQKAIVLSGGFTTSTPKEGQTKVESKLATVLVNRGLYSDKTEALNVIKSLNNEDLKKLFYDLTPAELAGMYKSFDLEMKDFPHGFTDGYVLPSQGFSVIRSGQYNRVPIMLGSDATEFATFGWEGSVKIGLLDEEDPAVLTAGEQYMVGTGIHYGSMLQSQFYLEQVASSLHEDLYHKEVYAFRMLWGTNASVTDSFYSKFVGAYHGQIRDFLLGNYKQHKKSYSPDAVSAKNEKGRVALTAVMRKYVANFLHTGNPNGKTLTEWTPWNTLTGIDKVMLFDAGKNKATAVMNPQMYEQADIFRKLSEVTAEADYETLTTELFAERFFMPGMIPSYY